jgi:hypothetical protein
MSQIPILKGIYTDGGAPDFRTAYPRNLIPVPKEQGISAGYLRQADGIIQTGTGPGMDRGGINWNGTMYRVMGAKLVKVSSSGAVTVLGDVGAGTTQATFDYSFDRLGIASAGSLYYWDGNTLTQVTDPDLGMVKDFKWIAGYFLTTDGTNLITTDLGNPASVNPLHYGSAEADPDPINAVDGLRNEAYAFGRYTIEVYQNVAGTGFPFSRIEGAQVAKGVIGTHMYTGLGNTFAFVGSGRGEAPAAYLMIPGDVQKISTREIDTILLSYPESVLSACVMETRVDKNHQHVLIHLPDQCLVYDTIASQVMQEPIWFTLTTSVQGLGKYRARGLVWCYDQWNVGDPTDSGLLGKLTDTVSSHYGQVNGWDFGTMVLYNDGNGAIIHELELVCLTGRVALGADPVIWTQYSLDGQAWSMERPTRAGKQGQRVQRICWRNQGKMQHWRIQRFRGTSEAHLAIARLEGQIEALFLKGGANG